MTKPDTFGNESAILGRLETRSERMQEVVEQARALARTPRTGALILGESGVGKELVAQAIHGLSERANKPIVTLDCAAVTPTLFESTLFGFEKGAFSGADSARIGRFEAADGGTLFLDEIGEMPLEQQAKLLRVLQERNFWPVGADVPRTADVRIIAATNRDLRAMVHAGRFREDLFYRLSVVVIRVPPLRERGVDILHLAEAFAQDFAREQGKTVSGISAAAGASLVSYRFPGNVRELRNIIERAMVRHAQGLLEIPPFVAAGNEEPDANIIRFDWEGDVLMKVQRELIQRALVMTEGNRSRAAQLLGIDRQLLVRRIESLAIDAPARTGRPKQSGGK